MIGVIVWSSSSREQAVIWCDDHAALAYLVGRENYVADCDWPQPGDLVQLTDSFTGDLRYARSVKPLADSVVGHLPALLNVATSSSAERPMTRRTDHNVITLRRAAG